MCIAPANVQRESGLALVLAVEGKGGLTVEPPTIGYFFFYFLMHF